MPEQSPSRCLSGKHLHHDHQKGETSLQFRRSMEVCPLSPYLQKKGTNMIF